jgi:DNA-binding transcriptional regulator LsrR (DeoR family)
MAIVPSVNEIRLMVKIAQLYHEQDMRQKEIADLLGMHQTTVSRFLRRAREEKIARMTIAMPPGNFGPLENEIEKRFGLKQVVVVETQTDEEHTIRELGGAAAFLVETTVRPGAVIGVSSWSRSLFAMVETMRPTDCGRGGKVVQMMGGVGTSDTYQYATQLVFKFARLIGAEPILLQAPGIVGSEHTRKVLCRDSIIRQALDLFQQIDFAMVGIGSMEPTPLLARSGNAFSLKDRREIQRQGAVGDICLRFYDRNGQLVKSEQDKRVIGIEIDTLLQVERVVGVASGLIKVPAILGALRSHRIHVLITDRVTAERILASPHSRS